MNPVAENVRFFREARSWTQEQLAQAADITVRTVQRIEQGQLAAAETLLAIAGALDLNVELLRTDPRAVLAEMLGIPIDQVTPEAVEQKLREQRERYIEVPVTVVTGTADLRCVLEADAMLVDSAVRQEGVQDAVAALRQSLLEALDVGGDLGPAADQELLKVVLEDVGVLNRLGCAVSVGVHHHGLRLKEGDPLRWRTLYVVVAPLDSPKTVVLVPRNMAVSFK